MPPLSEKVKVLNLIREKKKKNLYAEVTTIYSKNKSSISEIVQKEKETQAGFAVAPQTAKVMATVHDESCIMMEKAINVYNKMF